ncbi:MAG: hypothetical protein APF76_11175 [Desulfitibacter sp. BRH_c19]|nr:MAG: hypothetical protein APF76_11175 [Desulfitibacter sp. BRH_c19]
MRKNSLSEETISGKIYDWELIKRLLKYVKPYWAYITFSLMLLMIVSGVVLARPYIVKIAIDDHLLGDGNFNSIIQLVILYFTLITISFAANFIQNYLLNLTSQRIMYDIREEVFSHLQSLSLSFFDRNPVGRLVTRVANDTANLNEMFTEVLIGLIKDFMIVIGIVIVMLQLDVRLALISLISLPLILLATNIYKRVAQKAFQEARVKLAALNSSIQENVIGMKIVQIFNQQESRFKEYKSINKEHYNAELKAIKAHAFFRPAMDIIYFFIVVLLIRYGGAGVIQETIQLGVLYAFINYTERLFEPINDMTQKYTQLQSAVVSSERIFMLLDEKEDVSDPTAPAHIQDLHGRIEFKNVWFAYKNEDWVLKDVNFEVKAGETIALVGPTGSGKTTVINLLNRLYDIQKGEILVDGLPVKDLKQGELRSNTATVMQDVFLFSENIISNIHLDSNKITEEEAKKAAVHVGADEFIRKLPEGYYHQVKERGVTLSTGQRQLIAFARALAFDPKILILDEATANIDSQSEGLIQEAMEKLSKDRTTIVVAHRLSTIQNADKILVFHKGRLVEMGNHQELLRNRGMYYKLYQLQ